LLIEVNKYNIIKYIYYIELDGGIGRIEMLNTTNILALVGGGKNPKFSINKIIIWDDQKKSNNIIGELRFNTPVLNVKIKMDRLIGVCQTKIFIFNLNTLETLDMFDTFDNINGIVAFSPGELISVLAFPYDSKGKVRIVNFNSLAQPPIIQAHESKIACLSINRNGTLLATASDKGTLIRLFNAKDGKLLIELRRGSKNADINCIIFDEFNKYVACASANGTVHIFSIVGTMKNNFNENYYSDQLEEDEPKNQKSFLSNFNFLHKINSSYFGSEWSFAKLRLQEHKSIITFLYNNTICALTSDGKYYLASFDPKKPGDCQKNNEFFIYDFNNHKNK
jgi:WD40 repeat protein